MVKSFSACTGQAMNGRILVAEDDKMIQNFVFKFLDYMGFDVVTADNGIEAL
jgi:DNA-binding response OmpR family regulator